MKKFLSMLLCLCMLLSFMPVMGVNASDNNTDVLKMFGFNLDSSSYDTNGTVEIFIWDDGLSPVSRQFEG